MKETIVIWNNPIPVKRMTNNFVMGYNREGNPVIYRLKEDHSNYEFSTSNTFGLPRFSVDEDGETVRFLKSIFKDKFITIPRYGSKEDLESYTYNAPDPQEIVKICESNEKSADNYNDQILQNIFEGAKHGCRFCLIDENYEDQLTDVSEIEIRDRYDNKMIQKIKKETIYDI